MAARSAAAVGGRWREVGKAVWSVVEDGSAVEDGAGTLAGQSATKP
jgi:hypothetical protein